jgi:hypothetical protein
MGIRKRTSESLNEDGQRILPWKKARKRVLGIIAGILVARHLKKPEDLNNTQPTPRTEALVASAVQGAEWIMRKIDSKCSALLARPEVGEPAQSIQRARSCTPPPQQASATDRAGEKTNCA